jgi:hypothetical protein
LQLERINDEKLTQMLSGQKCSSNKTGLEYVASSSNITSTLKTASVKPAVPESQIAYVDKGKEIIRGEAKISEEPVKDLPSKRSLPICHHCGINGHIRPNCPQLRAQKLKVKKEEPKKAKLSTRPPKAH